MSTGATAGQGQETSAVPPTAPMHDLDDFRFALYLSIAFWVAHVVTFPVAVSYDGYVYIDLADIIGTDRFPRDWHSARTPLYPLALKAAFAVLGRQASAAIFVSSVFGLGATLLLTFVTKRLLGPVAASLVLALLSLYPTLVAFQHFVLTETGTAFFLALVLYLLLWLPDSTWGTWVKAAGLLITLAAGYYWRQALLSLAPVAALLHGASVFRVWMKSKRSSQTFRMPFRRELAYLIQVFLIAVGPYQLARPWSAYANDAANTDTILRQGILRQALLPPDHPYVGKQREQYRKAIEESSGKGSFYSGLRSDLHGALYHAIFSKPTPCPLRRFFLELICKHPLRYLAGVYRTLILFGGASALESENRTSRDMILSPNWTGAKFGQGPPHLEEQIRKDLTQNTSAGPLLRILNTLIPFYETFLVYATITTLIGLLAGCVTRDLTIITLCAVPLAFVVPPALSLASIDRYAFPAYPTALANGILVPALLWRRVRPVLSTSFRRIVGKK